MTRDEFKAKREVLLRDAESAFERARSKATSDSEKAELHHLEGWVNRIHGIYIDFLEQTLNFSEEEPIEENEAEEEEEEEMMEESEPETEEDSWDAKGREHFQKAVKLAKDMPLYWQSLFDVEQVEAKVSACHEVLRLAPKNAPLWFLLYAIERFRHERQKHKNCDLTKALFYLNKAAKYDAANAWYAYEEAELRLHGAAFPVVADKERDDRKDERGKEVSLSVTPEHRNAMRQALLLVQHGNALPFCEGRRIPFPVPDVLSVAWHYMGVVFPVGPDYSYSTDHFRELGRALSGFALYAMRQKNYREAEQTANALLGFGRKLAANYPTKKLLSRNAPGTISMMDFLMELENSHVISSVADDLLKMGFQTLSEVWRAQGRKEQAALLDKESELIRIRRSEQEDTLLKIRETSYELY